MKKGDYIKLYRSMIDWEHYTDANTLRVFLHLLLSATHKPTVYGGIRLKKGQFVTSSRTLSEELNMCLKNVTASIQKLRESGEITTEKAGFGTVFTITNYSDFQESDSPKSPKKDEKPENFGETGYNDF